METKNLEVRFIDNGVVMQTRERFAESVGVPVTVVQGWAEKGYLPIRRIGKYALVDVEALRSESARARPWDR